MKSETRSSEAQTENKALKTTVWRPLDAMVSRIQSNRELYPGAIPDPQDVPYLLMSKRTMPTVPQRACLLLELLGLGMPTLFSQFLTLATLVSGDRQVALRSLRWDFSVRLSRAVRFRAVKQEAGAVADAEGDDGPDENVPGIRNHAVFPDSQHDGESCGHAQN